MIEQFTTYFTGCMTAHPTISMVVIGCASLLFILVCREARDWPEASIVHIHSDGSETSFGRRIVSAKLRSDEVLSFGNQVYRVVSVQRGRDTGHLTVYVTGRARFGPARS